MKKFKEENSLLSQAWVMEPKKKSSRYYQWS
jgi:translation elongation factor EF-Ts